MTPTNQQRGKEMKIIKIKTCVECPFRATHQKLNRIFKVPFCNNTGDVLPYVAAKKTALLTAAPTNIIPDWCPLEEVTL